MSKSSQSTNFRAVDIDELDEERYQDDANDVQSISSPDENEIQNLLNAYLFIFILFCVTILEIYYIVNRNKFCLSINKIHNHLSYIVNIM